jgi:uncharacterized membrane protein YphA (DoxX/SURF4 family)
MNLLLALARIAFGLIFVWAAVDKIANPEAFAEIIYNYQIVPEPLINPAALALPWVEVVCGLALVAGVWAKGAVSILLGLMAVFMAALGYNLARGLEVACGCFSTGPESGGSMLQDLLRDAGILALGLLAAWGVWRRGRD